MPEESEGAKLGNILELLSMPSMENIEFDPPKLDDDFFRPAEFSFEDQVKAQSEKPR